MENNNRQKSRKLYFQISLIIIPLFLLTAAGIALIVYNTTVKGFLEAQNTLMSRQLMTILNDTCAVTNTLTSERVDWYFDKLEEYKAKILEADDEKVSDELINFYKTDTGSAEDTEKLSESVQYYLTKFFYDALYEELMSSLRQYRTTPVRQIRSQIFRQSA